MAFIWATALNMYSENVNRQLVECVENNSKRNDYVTFCWGNGKYYNRVKMSRFMELKSVETTQSKVKRDHISEYKYAVIYGETRENEYSMATVAKECKERGLHVITVVHVIHGTDYAGVIKPRLSEYADIIIPVYEDSFYVKPNDKMNELQTELYNDFTAPGKTSVKMSQIVDKIIEIIKENELQSELNQEEKNKNIKTRISKYMLLGA